MEQAGSADSGGYQLQCLQRWSKQNKKHYDGLLRGLVRRAQVPWLELPGGEATQGELHLQGESSLYSWYVNYFYRKWRFVYAITCQMPEMYRKLSSIRATLSMVTIMTSDSRYDTILACAQKQTSSQLSLPHDTIR